MKANFSDIIATHEYNEQAQIKFITGLITHKSNTIEKNTRVNLYFFKETVRLLNPFTEQAEDKKLIRQVLEDYLKEINVELTSPSYNHKLPQIHRYENQYYLLCSTGYIRDRHTKVMGHRIEFIRRQIGMGGQGCVFETATVIFDQHDSFNFKDPTISPRAVKKVFVRGLTLAAIENAVKEVKILGRFPYEDYKLKNHFYIRENEKVYLYIPHKLFRGEDLYNHLKGCQLDALTSINFALALGDALDYVKKYNIIHRDIKPENMIVPKDDRFNLRVIDFGCATFSAINSSGGVCGTHFMLAPECFDGVYNAGTDEYATLMSMATCFKAMDRFSTQTFLVRGKPDRDLDLFRAKRQQTFRKLGSTILDMPKSMSHAIKQTFREATNPDPAKRLPFEMVRKKLTEVKSIIETKNEESQDVLDIQYAEFLAEKIKIQLKSPYHLMVFVLNLISKNVLKLKDNEACIQAFVSHLNIKALLNCKSKKNILDIVEQVRALSLWQVCLREYTDLLKGVNVAKLSKHSKIGKLSSVFLKAELAHCNELNVDIHDDFDSCMVWRNKFDTFIPNYELRKMSALFVNALVNYRLTQGQSIANTLWKKSKGDKTAKQMRGYLKLLIESDSDVTRIMVMVAMLKTQALPYAVKHFVGVQLTRQENYSDSVDSLLRMIQRKEEDIKFQVDEIHEKINKQLLEETSKKLAIIRHRKTTASLTPSIAKG